MQMSESLPDAPQTVVEIASMTAAVTMTVVNVKQQAVQICKMVSVPEMLSYRLLQKTMHSNP
jgi:hypothetical protein